MVVSASSYFDEFSPELFSGPDQTLADAYERDAEESIPGTIAYGHKYMTGGTGEGTQLIGNGLFESREQVKSDSVLPAYCEPPNPCPVGFSAADGCMEQFENTADFSRDYQQRQECMCDEEHMFTCSKEANQEPKFAFEQPTEEAESFSQTLQDMLDENNIQLHQTLIAKKFHETRELLGDGPRRR